MRPPAPGVAFRRYGIPDSAGGIFPKKKAVLAENSSSFMGRIMLARNRWIGALGQLKHIAPEYLKRKCHVAVIKPPSGNPCAFLRCESGRTLVTGSRPPLNGLRRQQVLIFRFGWFRGFDFSCKMPLRSN